MNWQCWYAIIGLVVFQPIFFDKGNEYGRSEGFFLLLLPYNWAFILSWPIVIASLIFSRSCRRCYWRTIF